MTETVTMREAVRWERPQRRDARMNNIESSISELINMLKIVEFLRRRVKL